MANYVLSENIKVFPAGFRRSTWNQAKLTTEDNLTGFFGKLSKNVENNKFYFTLNDKHYIGIDGYIFVINGNLPSGTTHAFIKLKDLGGQIGSRLDNIANTGELLDSLDTASNSEFRGLGFGSAVESGCIGFKLGTGQPLRLDSTEIRNVVNGTASTVPISESFNTNHINGCELAAATNGFTLSGASSTLKLDNNSEVEINNNVTIGRDGAATVQIDAPITILEDATVSIGKPIEINSPLIVGSGTLTDATITIKSAGPSPTTIIGPNNGTINLPANPTLNGTYAFVSTRGGSGTVSYSPSMQKIEAFNGTNTYAAGTDTIVQRSSAGVAIEKIHVEELRAYGTNTNLILSATTDGTASAVIFASDQEAALGTPTPTGTMVIKGGLGVNKNIVANEGINVASVTSRGNISAASNSFVVSKSTDTASLSLKDATNCIVTIGDNSTTENGILNIYGKPTGSTTPTLIFRVNSSGLNTTVPITCSQAVKGYNFVATNTATASTSYTYSFANRASNPSFYVTTSGDVTAKSYNATSDIRKKENIVEFTPAKSILGLNVKKFDYIDGPKNQIGCIAQDLKEICPEIVNEDNEGYLTIQENKLVYLLLEEVKQLRKEVNELKNK